MNLERTLGELLLLLLCRLILFRRPSDLRSALRLGDWWLRGGLLSCG